MTCFPTEKAQANEQRYTKLKEKYTELVQSHADLLRKVGRMSFQNKNFHVKIFLLLCLWGNRFSCVLTRSSKSFVLYVLQNAEVTRQMTVARAVQDEVNAVRREMQGKLKAVQECAERQVSVKTTDH